MNRPDARLRLTFHLAIRSLRRQPGATLAAIFGVAISMQVAGAVLIVDHNTAHTKEQQELLARQRQGDAFAPASPPVVNPLEAKLLVESVTVLPAGQGQQTMAASAASGEGGREENSLRRLPQKQDQSFPAMRLAIRLSSLLAFLVGAVIIFHTLRHAVAKRRREFALLRCLGATSGNAVFSLLAEAAILGIAGTLCGTALALGTARLLLAMEISTNGLHPLLGFAIPWSELAVMIPVGISIALLGAIGPALRLWRLDVAATLKPDFFKDRAEPLVMMGRDFSWLIPPLLIASYVMVRPLFASWLPVAIFFFVEAAFAVVAMLLTLWLLRPMLHGLLRIFEHLLTPVIPLAAFLAGRRMRFASSRLAFVVAGVALAFALLGALHVVTRSLAEEIGAWSARTMHPYGFYARNSEVEASADPDVVTRMARKNEVHFFRVSIKSRGRLPARLVLSRDVNPFLADQGLPPLGVGRVILSPLYATRLAARPGDTLLVRTLEEREYRFEIIAISDVIGIHHENISYIDLKSQALFSEGNPLFIDNLERSLGDLAVARNRDPGRPPLHLDKHRRLFPVPLYHFSATGDGFEQWQTTEIHKDFLIFDFILFMTTVLAALGVTNTLLIQAFEKRRELAVLKSVGMRRRDLMKLVLTEGLMVGLLAACCAALLGQFLGYSAVMFLAQSTGFDYFYNFAPMHLLALTSLALAVSLTASLPPALSVSKVSSAESLHYE
ncbi:MAG: FtsX-like permease family protein [Magnetococcales bacterium]|nr:FtsX-like permease family protein [Magnetococcales bacterium]